MSSQGPVKGNIEVITPDKLEKIRQEFEDSTLRVWRTSKKIVPKMLLDFRVHFQEIYASTVGSIFVWTPFFRGRVFTDGILMHEFLHWAIYPIDLWQGLKDLFSSRRLLAEEIKFIPEIKETDLYGELEDWTKFPYQIREMQFVQNILGDYLINIHIHNYHLDLFEELWKFLFHDGTFYEQQKQLQRDTTFLLYLSVYPELLPKLDPVKLLDPQSEKDRDKIAVIITEVREGRMSKAFALKELVKIFHPYLVKDAKGQGQGQGQGGKMEPPKCPQCGHDEFEVTEYQDPQTGKWVKV